MKLAARRGPGPARPSHRRRLGAAALVLLCAALAAISSVHAAALRVLLLGPAPDDATVVRVQQELTLLGLEVEIVTPAAGADLAALAREHHASAAARVEVSPPEIVLWVDEAHSRGLPQETRVSESLSGRADPGLLALRAVELLRGRLIPVAGSPAVSTTATASAAGPEPPASSAAASATAPAPRASAAASASAAVQEPPPQAWRLPSRLSLHLGPSLAMSPGGVPVTPGLRAGAAWRVRAPIEVDALMLIPLTAGDVAADQGRMDLRVLAFGAGASARWLELLPRLSLHAGAGMGVAGFLFEGHAEAPYVAASGSAWSALPFLEGGAGLRITDMIAARADVLAAVALPPPVLVIAGREVASFGQPAVFVSLSLEVHP